MNAWFVKLLSKRSRIQVHTPDYFRTCLAVEKTVVRSFSVGAFVACAHN